MYFALLHERVRIEGREGVFRVVKVDYKRGLTDLVNQESRVRLNGVPFAHLLRKIRGSPKAWTGGEVGSNLGKILGW